MDIVENYLQFKKKWLLKLMYQISSLYDTSQDNLRWEKNIDKFLEDCISTYIENPQIDDSIFENPVIEINEQLLNKIDINLFKMVLYTFNKADYIMSNYTFNNLVFITILLECTIDIYRLVFDNYFKDDVELVLENNIIGIDFIEYRRRNRKLNIIYSYLEYLKKKQREIFEVLYKQDLSVNFIRLITEMNKYIANYDFRIMNLINYDNDIVREVYEDKLKDKRFSLITYQMTRLKVLLNEERRKENLNKVLFVINDNLESQDFINELEKLSTNKNINEKILLVSNDINKNYNSSLDIAYYYGYNKKVKSIDALKNKTIVVNKSFWNKNKKTEKRFIDNNINFITINDNINYLFEKKEVEV